LGKPLAETARKNGDPNADPSAPFGHRDLARIAWHHVPLDFERPAEVPPADLDIPVLGQLASAQLSLRDTL